MKEIEAGGVGTTDGILRLFIAGDVFDRWNSTPELINMAINHLPATGYCYAIPGQHDLPHHRYEDIEKSAYWTLVKAGKIRNLTTPGRSACMESEEGKDIEVFGFPWKSEIVTPKPNNRINIALIHAFCWDEGHTHPGAKEEDHIDNWACKIAGFDGAVFGDNHRPFFSKKHNTVNHGTFFRRRSDEKDQPLKIAVLMDDGWFLTEELDRPEEKWADEVTELAQFLEAGNVDTAELVELVRRVRDVGLSFKDITLRFLQDNPDLGGRVQDLIVGWLKKLGSKK